MAVDSGGEIVAASATGGKYAVYVWSIQTGNILEVLTGHTSHVEALHFSPSAVHPGQLVSASWDGTLAYLLSRFVLPVEDPWIPAFPASTLYMGWSAAFHIE